MSGASSTIVAAVREYLDNRPSSMLNAKELRRLHCPYRSSSNEVYFEHESLTVEDRVYLREWLPALLLSVSAEQDNPTGNASLLAAISHYASVDDYLKCEDTAYALAVALVFYIGGYTPGYPLDEFVAPYVCDILNKWIAPQSPFIGLPGVVTVCRAFFGDAWSVLALPDGCPDAVGRRDLDNHAHQVDAIILRDRPPFLPGLCHSQDGILASPLPECVGPPS